MKNVINIEKITSSIDKLKYYNRDDNVNFTNIISEFRNFCDGYSSDNFDYFSQNIDELTKKFGVIKANHYNDEVILMNAVNNYSNVSKNVSKIFREI